MANTKTNKRRARTLSGLDTDFLISLFFKAGGRNTKEGRTIYNALKLQAAEGRHAYAK
jgi:hypothetical protein